MSFTDAQVNSVSQLLGFSISDMNVVILLMVEEKIVKLALQESPSDLMFSLIIIRGGWLHDAEDGIVVLTLCLPLLNATLRTHLVFMSFPFNPNSVLIVFTLLLLSGILFSIC